MVMASFAEVYKGLGLKVNADKSKVMSLGEYKRSVSKVHFDYRQL